MRHLRILAVGLLALGVIAVTGVLLQPWSAVGAAADGDVDGVPDSADACPSLSEDPDGVDDLDGCPDTDVAVWATMEEAYTVSAHNVETRTVDISIQNGDYPADILVHALAVSTIGACEVSLVAAAGDGVVPLVTDEDGDTTAETYSYLLEWEISLGAGESYQAARDYEVVCSLLGEHSFEIQVDAVPWPPVEEEDVEDLPNVRKSFPLLTVTDDPGPDSDGDGFSDGVEALVGTDSTVACAATPNSDDEEPDASPPDFDDNQVVNILDVAKMLPPHFGMTTGSPGWNARRDLVMDGVISILDVGMTLPPTFGQNCQ